MTILKAAEIFATVSKDVNEIKPELYKNCNGIEIKLYDIINGPYRAERMVVITADSSILSSTTPYYALHELFTERTSPDLYTETNFKKLLLLGYETPQAITPSFSAYNIDVTFPIDLVKEIPPKVIDSGLLLVDVNNPSECRFVNTDNSFLKEDLEFFKEFNPELFGKLELNRIIFNHSYTPIVPKYKLRIVHA